MRVLCHEAIYNIFSSLMNSKDSGSIGPTVSGPDSSWQWKLRSHVTVSSIHT